MKKTAFNFAEKSHFLGLTLSQVELGIGNLFLLMLMGSLFLQPKPAVVIMVLSVLIVLMLIMTSSGRNSLQSTFSKESYLITFALLMWFLTHLLVVFLHPPVVWRNLGNYARIFAAIGVFVFLVKVKPDAKYLYIGVVLACAGALAHSINDRFIGHSRRAVGWFNNEIHFGNYSSLAGVFALMIGMLALDLKPFWRWTLFSFGLLGFSAAAISGTRSALLALLCLTPLIFIRTRDSTQKNLWRALALALVCLTLLITLSPIAQRQLRLTEAVSDIKDFQQGKAQTSIADRFEMWKAALNMFKRSPLIGVGMHSFQADLQHQIDTQQIRPLNAMQNQAHNQILHSLATGGIVLLTAYILFLAMPLKWFWQMYKAHGSDPQMLLWINLGLANIGGHIIFGLTNAVFDIQIFSSFYVLCLASTAAVCLNRQHALHKSI